MFAFRDRGAVIVAADAVLLWLLHPSAPATLRGLSAPRTWLAHDGADRVAVTLAGTGLWCLAVWVGVALAAGLLAHAPGATGRAAGRVARVALPAVLRRLVVGSAGLGVLLAPVSNTTLAAAAATTDAPGDTGGRPVAAAQYHASGTPLPGPTWPGSGEASLQPAPAPPTAPRPAPAPEPKTAPAPKVATEPAPKTTHATVRADDSLWLLGTRRLGPHADDADVAAYVSTLYRANRDVIGDDPDLLRPGQNLTLPPPHPTE